MVQFYKEKIGQEFDGMISWVIPSWFFVVLPDTVEGFVEMRGYLNDMLHEIQIAWKKYRLWDKIRVKLYDTDEERLRLCFHVV
jgi:exoribonuclease R